MDFGCFRALDVRANRKNRRMLDLVVRASDMGSPPLYNDVDVRIFVEDVNDHGPRFEKDLYNVEIPENTKGGIPILKVYFVIVEVQFLSIQICSVFNALIWQFNMTDMFLG